jgi:hypothetical protein
MKPLPSGNVESLVRTGDHIEKHRHYVVVSIYIIGKEQWWWELKHATKRKTWSIYYSKENRALKLANPYENPIFIKQDRKSEVLS